MTQSPYTSIAVWGPRVGVIQCENKNTTKIGLIASVLDYYIDLGKKVEMSSLSMKWKCY